MTMLAANPDLGGPFVLVFVLGVFCLWLAPSVIAFSRGHPYRWIILVLSVTPAWPIAGLWSIWPGRDL